MKIAIVSLAFAHMIVFGGGAQAETECLRMVPDKPMWYGVHNDCDEKRLAELNWCDGSKRYYCIAPEFTYRAKACAGTIRLVAEKDC